ncbi:MAG: porin [Sporomusaceae bacterium]|nr:porin [Sporomusaceae bacterium]
MRKAKVVALLAALGMACSATAFAAPVDFNGEVSLKYQRDRDVDGDSNRAMIGTLTVDAQTKIADDLTLFGRLGAQTISRYGFGDFAENETKKSVLAIDQFGVIWEKNELAFKLGRQDLEIGATSLLYSRSNSNIGKHSFVDGLTVNGFVGDTEIAAVLAKEDNKDEPDSRLYALRAAYSQLENWTFGATLARYDNREDTKTNHWAVDAAYQFGKSTLSAEVAKSNADAEDQAYAVVWDHECDDRTSFSVTGFRVENQASMGEQSDFDSGNKGIHYTVNYKLAENMNLEAVYKDQKQISDNRKNNSTEVTLTVAF